ncbi:hypothetical protein [Streptomyces virginiae]|uniref:hypothetical protein n=1 Tax=Streptomyces virginiae TaxID=1961 RepID=UPI0036FCBB8D
MVEDVGVVLAGRGGSRMLRILNIRLSRVCVLSQLMRVPLPPLATPRVLGADDFALYGGTYGTLLVDVTTRLPLTLWEGRDAEQLGHWLREHPGVEVACRDGSLTYRQGITAGAPEAVQVSDRLRLWKGLSRRVQDIASAHRGCLPAALPTVSEDDHPPIKETAENAAAGSRAGRHAQSLFEAVQALTRSGRSHSSVARELGLDCRTVGKYARARTWQEVMRRPPRSPPLWTLPRPSAATLGRGTTQREGPARGSAGQGLPRPLPARENGRRTTPTRPTHRRATRATTLPSRSGPLDHHPPAPPQSHINERLLQLLEHCPELELTHDPVRRFATMLDNRDAPPLPGWLSDLANSGLAPLAGLAGVLQEDRHAVAQEITSPYNSGVNEGRISPTSSCRNASWPDEPASLFSATASS